MLLVICGNLQQIEIFENKASVSLHGTELHKFTVVISTRAQAW